jgi:hypothetical protein
MLAGWLALALLHREDRRRWRAAISKHRGVWNNNELRRAFNSWKHCVAVNHYWRLYERRAAPGNDADAVKIVHRASELPAGLA